MYWKILRQNLGRDLIKVVKFTYNPKLPVLKMELFHSLEPNKIVTIIKSKNVYKVNNVTVHDFKAYIKLNFRSCWQLIDRAFEHYSAQLDS